MQLWGGVVYPVATTGICFDASWSLIKDQGTGADGSATSGAACGNFVLAGGSLAGVQLIAPGNGTASVSWTINAFAVNHVELGSSKSACTTSSGCNSTSNEFGGQIVSPYTFSQSGSLSCSLTDDDVSQSMGQSYTFTTLGSHALSAGVSCSVSS